jgi:plasmid maintenance system killer protein
LKQSAAHIRFIFSILFIVFAGIASAQYKIKGTVYDSSRVYRIEAVTVMSTGGRMTMTDSMGRYQIMVNEKDSLWFSYLGKPTPKYPVLKIIDVNQFDIALRLKSNVMQEVRIRSRSYRIDSIQNRKDYARVFDFHRPNVASMTSIGPTGAGIDLDELIRVFQFRKNKSMEKFKERLEEQERQKFIDHRFNKALVRRLTNLDSSDLDVFMLRYRPSYAYALTATEYDFQLYIKKCFELYKSPKSF